jgi:hypothetical protein
MFCDLGTLTYRISFAVLVLATCNTKIRLNVILTSTAFASKWTITATIPQHGSLHYLSLYCTNYHSQFPRYEVHINKRTSIVPQQAQDRQCLTQLCYTNSLRERSYFDVDDSIMLKQILKNEEWLGLAQDRKKRWACANAAVNIPVP